MIAKKDELSARFELIQSSRNDTKGMGKDQKQEYEVKENNWINELLPLVETFKNNEMNVTSGEVRSGKVHHLPSTVDIWGSAKWKSSSSTVYC